jgi:hypothetical protein
MSDPLFSDFLPIGAQPPPRKPKPQNSRGGGNGTGSDNEASPDVQRARRLGQFGFNLLDLIYKAYQKQITVWKDAFDDILAAFATAIQNRDKTFDKMREEHERDAQWASLVLSLATSGAMQFAGAFVQYTFVPNLKIPQPPSMSWDFSQGLGKVPGLKLVPRAPFQFSQLQAAAFGGITQDLGNKLIPLAFPNPPKVHYETDSWAGVNNLHADFDNLIDDSSQVVLDQIAKVQTWMNSSPEFGAAWAAFNGGNEQVARQQILDRIDGQRQQWARDWQFYGKTPKPFVRQLLSDQYERALWAGYLVPRLRVAHDNADIGGPKISDRLENALVDRLEALNITYGDSVSADQIEREHGGSPVPVVAEDLRGANFDHDLFDWAVGYLNDLPASNARDFFPPATARNLEPLAIN